MPTIRFHVLVPDADVEDLAARFQQLSKKLVDAAQATDIALTYGVVSCPEEQQLRQIYRDEHEGKDLEAASTYHYELSLTGMRASLNETAMRFSRLLTPPVPLPAEATILEREEMFEVPARFPWTVVVRP